MKKIILIFTISITFLLTGCIISNTNFFLQVSNTGDNGQVLIQTGENQSQTWYTKNRICLTNRNECEEGAFMKGECKIQDSGEIPKKKGRNRYEIGKFIGG